MTVDSKICTCEIVNPDEIRVTRCAGQPPTHLVCGGVIEKRTSPQRNWERRG